MSAKQKIHIVGGGLAGCEAAWQLLKCGHEVSLHEMRPKKMTAAHKTENLAELVCSNSFKSLNPDTASGRLKKEMQSLDSLVLKSAFTAQVPAGQALAVDRNILSERIKSDLCKFKTFTIIEEEVTNLPSNEELLDRNEIYLISSGPLTSSKLAKEIAKLCDENHYLYFYDAIAPIIDAHSIDFSSCFKGNRYENPSENADYLNLPLNKEQYYEFVSQIQNAEKLELHSFEEVKYFESCLPLEVMADRGVDTLRFGPLKPVGFIDPKTGKMPYAVVQLRAENKGESMFSMVGFQTKMKWPEQKRVFQQLPSLENAEFHRFGSIHRNTYVHSPSVLNQDFSFKKNNRIFLAGQLTGVEGYLESTAMGLIVGRSIQNKLSTDSAFNLPPQSSVLGSLAHYVLSQTPRKRYSPMNAHWGLASVPEELTLSKKRLKKEERKKIYSKTAEEHFQIWHKNLECNSTAAQN